MRKVRKVTKTRVATIAAAVFAILLIVFSPAAAKGARDGYKVWESVLLPSLLPFFICASALRHSGGVSNGWALFAMSFISGAPTGAKLVSTFEDERDMTAAAAALNSISPAFVISAYSIKMLSDFRFAIVILAGQFASSLLAFLIARKAGALPAPKPVPPEAPQDCETPVFARAVLDSISSLLSILATVVFFSAALSILRDTGAMALLLYPVKALVTLLGGDAGIVEGFFASLLDAATGSVLLASSGGSPRAIAALSAFAFSFAGVCVYAQSAAFLKLNFGKYALVKLAQAALAALVAFFAFPLVFGAEAVSCALVPRDYEALLDTVALNAKAAAAIFVSSAFAMAVAMVFSVIFSARNNKKAAK